MFLSKFSIYNFSYEFFYQEMTRKMYSLIVLREADVDAIRDPTSSSASSNSTQLYEVHDYENPDPNFHAVDPQIWKEKMIKFIGELFDDFRLPCSREKCKQITI